MNSKKYFDEVAHKWDEMRKSFFSEEVREKAFSVAGVKAGETAADIGAGTGFITEGLIHKCLKVIAVDQSEAMLEEMEKKFADAKDVEYCKGEAEKLPILDDAVDYVFGNMYLHHVEHPLEAIKEMVRILKPNGKLIITDMDEHAFDFLLKEHHDRWMGFKREDIETWFKEADLRAIVVDCIGECCAQSGLKDEFAEVSVFVASGLK